MRLNEPVTNREVDVPAGEPLVSKTDSGGRITFANRAFVEVSGYSLEELIGAPHNLVRHPHMPKEAFANLWATIKAGRPWEGLVKNRTKQGDFYWVRANVTPVLEDGKVTGFISIRAKPTRAQVSAAETAYRLLREGKGSGIGLRDGLLTSRSVWQSCRTAAASVMGRLAMAGVVCALIIGIVGWLGLQGMSASNQALHKVYDRAAVDTAHITDIRAAMRADVLSVTLMVAELRADRPAGVPKLIQAVTDTDAHIDQLLAAYMQTDLSPMQADLARQFVANREAFVRDGLKPAVAVAKQGDAVALDDILHNRVMPLFATAAATNGKLVNLQMMQAEATLTELTDSLQVRFRAAIGMMLLGAVVLVGVGVVLLRTIKRPLRQLGENFAAIARNDLTHEIEMPAAPEFWEIVGNLQAMRASLRYAASERTEFEQRAQVDRRNAVQAMADQVEREAGQAMERVASDTGEMARQADNVAEITQRVSSNAESVTEAAGHALSNAQAVGAASEQLSASIQEISAQIGRATEVARRAVDNGEQAQQQIKSLSEGALRIGDVVQIIRSIAGQTNLLALNATIEAARAGEAGRGFNVVASEVKGLAGQTARSTEEISRQVSAIQESTNAAVAVVADLGQSIEEIAQVFTGIAAAVEQQAAATHEIARNVSENSDAVQAVTERIADVSRDAVVSRQRADGIRSGSATVAESIAALRGSLVRTIRTATTDADRRISVRVPVDEPCTVTWGGKTFRGRLADVSAEGAWLHTAEAIAIGSIGTLKLEGVSGDASADFVARSTHPDGSVGVLYTRATMTPAFATAMQRLAGAAKQSAA